MFESFKKALRNTNEAGQTKPLLITLAIGAAGFGAFEAGYKIDEDARDARSRQIEGSFEFVSTDGQTTKLKRDGKIFTVKNKFLSSESKEKIAKAYPEFKSFIEGGPINILPEQARK